MALYAFGMTVIAAALTAFYSWRLIFMTFHGSPHDRHHYEQARESPMVMLIPLGFLAAGSIFAGYPFKELFVGHGVAEFFREFAQVRRRATTSSKTCTTFLTWHRHRCRR